jgi:hypothetical protein
VRLEEESRKSKPRRRGADLRIPDGRFVKNQTPECGVKFHAWISLSTVGPRKVQVSRDVDRPVTIKATVIEKKIVFAKPARRFRRVYGVSPQPFRRWASSPRPFRRGCSAADLFLATCYSYFSINLTKRRVFSVSCQCHLFINGLIASQRPRGFSDT